MKEMNGRLCGSRPMKVMKSEWQKKDVKNISLAELFLGLLNRTLRNKRRKRNGLQRQSQKHILLIISPLSGLFVLHRKRRCSGF